MKLVARVQIILQPEIEGDEATNNQKKQELEPQLALCPMKFGGSCLKNMFEYMFNLL